MREYMLPEYYPETAKRWAPISAEEPLHEHLGQDTETILLAIYTDERFADHCFDMYDEPWC